MTVALPARPGRALDAVVERLVDRFGPRALRDEPLGPRCTYRVGGTARLLVVVENRDELDLLAEILAEEPVDVLCVGRGSNLLVSERGFDGVAVVLGEGLAEITVADSPATPADPEVPADPRRLVCAGGATVLPVLARRTVAAGLRGFEWAVGVPGSVGGAVAMNAGGHGSDMASSLVRVEVVDLHVAGSRRWWTIEELQLRYRGSALGPSQVVVQAELALVPGDRDAAEALLAEIVAWRRTNQPGGQNAGSVFTNPPGDSAGRIIDAAGAKGLRVGTAEVSPKHANFIQADAGGRAEDVYALMGEVRRRVLAAGGPLLVPETRMIGFTDPLPPSEAAAGPAEGPA